MELYRAVSDAEGVAFVYALAILLALLLFKPQIATLITQFAVATRRVKQMEWSIGLGKFRIRFGPVQQAEGEEAASDSPVDNATESDESFAALVIEERPLDATETGTRLVLAHKAVRVQVSLLASAILLRNREFHVD